MNKKPEEDLSPTSTNSSRYEAREQHTSHSPHYHCVMLLNGNKTRHYHQVFESVERF